MPLPKYKAKRDIAEKAIRDALTNLGIEYDVISRKDEPDLRVWFRGDVWHLEVKTDKGKLSPGQRAWHKKAREHGFNVAVARTPEAALKAIGAIND